MEDPSRLLTAAHGAGVTLPGGIPPPPPPAAGDPAAAPPPGPPPAHHDTGDVLQQIMAITDQSLDEAQARNSPGWRQDGNRSRHPRWKRDYPA